MLRFGRLTPTTARKGMYGLKFQEEDHDGEAQP
jgi:hypothetical protein